MLRCVPYWWRGGGATYPASSRRTFSSRILSLSRKPSTIPLDEQKTRVAAVVISISASAALLLLYSDDNKRVYCQAQATDERSELQTTNNNVDSLSGPEKDASTVSTLRLCGPWCAKADSETPCRMDDRKIQCRGEFCKTTAGLWKVSVLNPPAKRCVTCEAYKGGMAYPASAVPCASCCLIPEINPQRYPYPTGLGVFCKPGTCRPAASPLHHPESGLGLLQCPCNWFGSECTDTAQRILSVTKTTLPRGNLIHFKILVDDTDNQILAEDRPGSVVRLQEIIRSKDNQSVAEVYEMSCAVARRDRPDASTTLLELLVSRPSQRLDSRIRHLSEQLRALPDGTHSIRHTTGTSVATFLETLHANPVISGFYNSRYQFLMDYLKEIHRPSATRTRDNSSVVQMEETTETTKKIQSVVFVASGSAMAGVVAGVAALLNDAKMDDVKIHVYYGIRHTSEMPFREQWGNWIMEDKVSFTLVESEGTDTKPKFYVQHAVARDVGNGVLNVKNSVFVACGHLDILNAVREILPASLRSERLFLNI